MTETLLELQHAGLDIPVGGRLQPVVHDVTLTVARGESVGLVGESGSGKSMTARTTMRLPRRGWRPRGTVRFAGLNPLDPEADISGKVDALLKEFKLPAPAAKS